MTVSQRAQYQDSETGSLKLNAVVINVINYTYFPATTCQNVCCEKALLNNLLYHCGPVPKLSLLDGQLGIEACQELCYLFSSVFVYKLKL